MQKRNPQHKHNNHDLYGDFAKIKAALTDTAVDISGKAGEMLSDSLKSVKQQSDKVQTQIAAYAAKKPFKALGMALLTGVLIGLYLRRK